MPADDIFSKKLKILIEHLLLLVKQVVYISRLLFSCGFSDNFLIPAPTRQPLPRPCPQSRRLHLPTKVKVNDGNVLVRQKNREKAWVEKKESPNCFLVGLLCFLGGMALAIVITLLIVWCHKTLPEQEADYDMDYSEDESQFENTIHDDDMDLETEAAEADTTEEFGAENKESSENVYQLEEMPAEKY